MADQRLYKFSTFPCFQTKVSFNVLHDQLCYLHFKILLRELEVIGSNHSQVLCRSRPFESNAFQKVLGLKSAVINLHDLPLGTLFGICHLSDQSHSRRKSSHNLCTFTPEGMIALNLVSLVNWGLWSNSIINVIDIYDENKYTECPLIKNFTNYWLSPFWRYNIKHPSVASYLSTLRK